MFKLTSTEAEGAVLGILATQTPQVPSGVWRASDVQRLLVCNENGMWVRVVLFGPPDIDLVCDTARNYLV